MHNPAEFAMTGLGLRRIRESDNRDADDMQNVEYKSELRDADLARTILRAIGAGWVATFRQIDTYYRVPDARLKKRETQGHPTEWVFYQRASRARPKLSTFTIYPEAMARERFGETPLPVWCVVRKSRELYLSREGVRIHIDTVEGLGLFVEFEALICPERNLARCHEAIDGLRRALAPAMGEPVACGYADLAAAEIADDTRDTA
jgi:adenylate cyclase class IV